MLLPQTHSPSQSTWPCCCSFLSSYLKTVISRSFLSPLCLVFAALEVFSRAQLIVGQPSSSTPKRSCSPRELLPVFLGTLCISSLPQLYGISSLLLGVSSEHQSVCFGNNCPRKRSSSGHNLQTSDSVVLLGCPNVPLRRGSHVTLICFLLPIPVRTPRPCLAPNHPRPRQRGSRKTSPPDEHPDAKE